MLVAVMMLKLSRVLVLAAVIEWSDSTHFRGSTDVLRFMLLEWLKSESPVAGGTDIGIAVVSAAWAFVAATAVAAGASSASLADATLLTEATALARAGVETGRGRK
jgi:hypothetical protein